jgi:hypothetical protein
MDPTKDTCFSIALWLSKVSTLKAEAQVIVENFGNTLILRCSASEQGGTARFASRLIGEREIVRTHESRSSHPGKVQTSKTHSEHYVTESAVLPSRLRRPRSRASAHHYLIR